jgi:hypothetical protein
VRAASITARAHGVTVLLHKWPFGDRGVARVLRW